MTDAHQDQPELFEAYWDRDQVDALFADLKQGAKISQVQVRTMSGNNRPSDSAVTLEQFTGCGVPYIYKLVVQTHVPVGGGHLSEHSPHIVGIVC